MCRASNASISWVRIPDASMSRMVWPILSTGKCSISSLTFSCVNASLHLTGPLAFILSANRTGFLWIKSLASALCMIYYSIPRHFAREESDFPAARRDFRNCSTSSALMLSSFRPPNATLRMFSV